MNPHDKHNHSIHKGNIRRYVVVLLITLAIFIVEIVGSWFTQSLALGSDAFHMLVDGSAIIVALFAEYKARDSSEAPRVKAKGALVNGFLLLFVTIVILFAAIERLQNPSTVLPDFLLIVATIGLAGNLFAKYLLERGGQSDINKRALLRHVKSDLACSALVIVNGILIYFTNWFLLDPIFSILIAVFFIGQLAIKTIFESIRELKR